MFVFGKFERNKINKLFLYITYFTYFNYLTNRLSNLKMHNFLNNFNYI